MLAAAGAGTIGSDEPTAPAKPRVESTPAVAVLIAPNRRLSGDGRLKCVAVPGTAPGNDALPEIGSYRSVVIASGSPLPVTRISTVRICEVGMLVAADSPFASSPAGFHEPTVFCTPSCVVTTMS